MNCVHLGPHAASVSYAPRPVSHSRGGNGRNSGRQRRSRRAAPLLLLGGLIVLVLSGGRPAVTHARAQQPPPPPRMTLKPRWPLVDMRSKEGDITAFVRYFKEQGYVVSTLRQQFQANGQVIQFTLVAAKRTAAEVSTIEATIEKGKTSIQVHTTVLVRP